MYLGNDEINEMFLGADPIAEAYLGEDLVFSSGPFVGLKMNPNRILFDSTQLSASTKVKSSESWSITSCPAWMTANPSTGDSGQTIVTFTTTAMASDTSGTLVIDTANFTLSAICDYQVYRNPVPNTEMWYTASVVQDPFRPGDWFTSQSQAASGLTQAIIYNTYDSEDGVYKIKWKYDLECSCGSGFRNKAMKSVQYPDSFVLEEAENFAGCTILSAITYGECETLGLQQGAWPPNLFEVYCRCKTEPYVDGYDERGNYGRLCVQAGVFHYPAGSNWSTFIATLPNGWTAVDDLPNGSAGGSGSTPTNKVLTITQFFEPTNDTENKSVTVQIGGTIIAQYSMEGIDDGEANVIVNVTSDYAATGYTASYSNGTYTIEGPFDANPTVYYSRYDPIQPCYSIGNSETITFTGSSATTTVNFSPGEEPDPECDCQMQGGVWDVENQECVFGGGGCDGDPYCECLENGGTTEECDCIMQGGTWDGEDCIPWDEI